MLRTLFAAAALTLVPALASAACDAHDRQAMSCTDGMIYDAATNTCKVVSG
ncbi:adenylosuccinate lyase [Citreimonas salinaria]|uniref:Chitin binding Peritrophin-A domain-containing protein n=1 Tax=Citreimonas salinaria TaxID=321339 RepID=A0A1H3G2W1_9RHOB|nr:adenylosuccinate lyase [Citreimonas salinaria]SDX97357.1 hypothetical protein SAMN05444340_102113 [Citreimonas salinaria]